MIFYQLRAKGIDSFDNYSRLYSKRIFDNMEDCNNYKSEFQRLCLERRNIHDLYYLTKIQSIDILELEFLGDEGI